MKVFKNALDEKGKIWEHDAIKDNVSMSPAPGTRGKVSHPTRGRHTVTR